MKYLLTALFLLLMSGCTDAFTINGLVCPTNDRDAIAADMQACQIYDLDKIDIALRNGTCKKCLEDKGYVVDTNASKQ